MVALNLSILVRSVSFISHTSFFQLEDKATESTSSEESSDESDEAEQEPIRPKSILRKKVEQPEIVRKRVKLTDVNNGQELKIFNTSRTEGFDDEE